MPPEHQPCSTPSSDGRWSALMRVLYLGSTDLPQPKARAIQIVHTCHALARAGADVTLVAGRRGRRGPRSALRDYGLAPHPRLRLIRVPIARIPPTAPPKVLAWFTRVWQMSYLAGLMAILPGELAARRPDVIFARDLRTARLAVGPARAVGARLVFEVHGLPSFEVAQRAGRANLPTSEVGRLRSLEQDVFDRADLIVTITECARQILIDDYRVLPARVRTVADGTTLRPVEIVPTRAALPADAPAIYYVGQLYPWKGAGLVVEVAARVPEARFVIVGGMPNGERGDPDVDALQRRAQALGISDRVDLRGYLPYRQVAEELAQARAALLPLPDEPVARYFTSPLKLFDYMAAGVPIVSSNLPALCEVLRHEDNALLAEAGNADAFAAAIRRLLADPPLATRLGHQARVDVARYSWDARAAALLSFLGSGADRSVA
jgi:glycosyltransferase involved in cell wall biosynthesis